MVADGLGGARSKRSKGKYDAAEEGSGTQGVWMWSEPVYHEELKYHIIILDFQGFSTTRQEKGHKARSSKLETTDHKLFALCTLLSSQILYNVERKFDEKTMQELMLLGKFDRYIRVRSSQRLLTLGIDENNAETAAGEDSEKVEAPEGDISAD